MPSFETVLEIGLTRLCIEGFQSIINPHRTVDDPIWSAPFEMLNPLRLARDHEAAVKEFYGDKAW